MLETAEERVKLLKAGLVGKTIERLYIETNNFKIVTIPDIIELVDFDFPQKEETVTKSEIEVLSRGNKMILKEDCCDFRYLKKDIAESGAEQSRFMNIPNCRIHKMSLCGCSETCSYYSVNVLAVSE